MDVREDRSADVREVQREALGGRSGTVIADLVGDLLRDPAALSLVATENGRTVGHVMFVRSLLDAPPRLVEVRTLSPLGVLPAYQRKGFGTALIRHGLALLEERRVPLVFVEGDPGYYRRAGFEPAGAYGFRRPSLRIPEAAFQVRRLTAYESWMTGTLVYPAPFWEHDAVGLRDGPLRGSVPDGSG
jgi:putative acetyltransferase